jgi:hypothetical protein
MRWLTLAVLFLCALSATAQDANKNPNKKEPPILGPHWSNWGCAFPQCRQ